MPRSTLYVLAAALAGVSLACGSADPTPAPSPFAALEEYLSELLHTGGMPGVAAAIIEGGRVRWTGTFGYADLDARRPVDVDTPFLVASISKTFVATLAVHLADEERLDLDAPIDDVLGLTVPHPGPPDRFVTARDLATHTSGLSDDWIALGAATQSGDSPVSLAEFARDYLVAEHFARAPGRGFEYSNSGFGVLGAVVEAAAGEPLPALSARVLFEPLGLTETGWHLADLDTSKLAVPYGGTWEDGFDASEHQGFDFYPATSLRTSVRDLSKWVIAFLARGETPSGARLVSDAAFTELFRPQVPAIRAGQGLAWYDETFAGRTWMAHTGSAVGASALIALDVEAGRGIVLLTNADVYLRDRLGFPEGAAAFHHMRDRLATEALPVE
ncbi:beta-lactamase family protein [Myxococcota bacterium]|nr:beta-lactamase family protein [Myxococcota bacterium]